MVCIFLLLTATKKCDVQTAWLPDFSAVQLLETVMQCTVHSAYFKPGYVK